jgi:hypothetical protein
MRDKGFGAGTPKAGTFQVHRKVLHKTLPLNVGAVPFGYEIHKWRNMDAGLKHTGMTECVFWELCKSSSRRALSRDPVIVIGFPPLQE